MMQLSFRDAIQRAIDLEMERDNKVFVMGLDVDDHKAIYNSLKGLREKFGSDRVFSTPLSEEGATGFAIGAAISGHKVIHIHIRADFCLLAFNQIINMASNIHYLTNGALSVPLTIRCVVGRGWGQGAQHSKSLHGMLSQVPGLKVFSPARPQDIYSCLRQCIQDPNPCVILEHRWLYDISGPVIESSPYQSATRLKEGSDLTLVSTSWMSVEALEASEALESLGVSCEVIDVSQMAPMDLSLVFDSVKKTGRVLVCDCDWLEFGMSAEVLAQISEHVFSGLKSPPRRLGFKPLPCPTARTLESQFYPNTQDIVSEVLKTLGKPQWQLPPEKIQSYEQRFKGPF